MNCAEANKVGLVDYSYLPGVTTAKISDNDYSDLFSSRNEKIAPFIELTDLNRTASFDASYFSFQQQNHQQKDTVNNTKESPFRLQENSLLNNTDAAETAMQRIAAKQPVISYALCRYLKERRITKNIAHTYCHQARLRMNNYYKEFVVIGFKNGRGVYELGSDFFKLGCTPKYTNYINSFKYKSEIKTEAVKDILNSSNDLKNESKKSNENFQIIPLIVLQKVGVNSATKDETDKRNQPINKSKSIAAFARFFAFLSWQTIHENQQRQLTIFPAINLPWFLERRLLLTEKNDSVHHYLKRNRDGKIGLGLALKSIIKHGDRNGFYKDYGDLNE